MAGISTKPKRIVKKSTKKSKSKKAVKKSVKKSVKKTGRKSVKKTGSKKLIKRNFFGGTPLDNLVKKQANKGVRMRSPNNHFRNRGARGRPLPRAREGLPSRANIVEGIIRLIENSNNEENNVSGENFRKLFKENNRPMKNGCHLSDGIALIAKIDGPPYVKDKQYLLMCQAYSNKVGVPKGSREKGESSEDAAEREFKEEAGELAMSIIKDKNTNHRGNEPVKVRYHDGSCTITTFHIFKTTINATTANKIINEYGHYDDKEVNQRYWVPIHDTDFSKLKTRSSELRSQVRGYHVLNRQTKELLEKIRSFY